ncbi:putative P-loop containing nucleoside triphosphate hydrolase [Plasmopara halstedii]
MADESIRNANHAVAQALAEVNRNTEKIKEPRYKRLKARLKEAKDDLTEAREYLKKVREYLTKAREYHLKLALINVQHIHKKDMISTVAENEHMNSIAQILDIDAWQVGGISIDICRVESDFPEWFYIRTETLDIIKVFKAQMEAGLHIVFVGTAGVGKSMLLVLFAFYMALCQKKRVVLFRKKKKGFSMLYMDGENEQYWRMDRAEIEDLDRQLRLGAELCLDGIRYDDIDRHFGKLGGFRLLATSVHYPMKDDDLPVLRQCLVPFWSKCDLNAIGTHREWQEHEIKDKYFYSGGNLCDFLSERNFVKSSINQAIRKVEPMVAKLLDTQYGGSSVRQVDRLRMTGFPADDQRDLNMYMLSENWICKITSEYALRQLDGKKIELQVRAYDRAKAREHTYVALELESKSCRNDGMDAAECDTIMKQLSSSSDDYWYPSSRSLKTINSVAKMTMPGQQNVVGLIQITKSDHHKIDSEIYCLVPDKKTCDNFRLTPANPATKVPLDVAYITTWNRDVHLKKCMFAVGRQ